MVERIANNIETGERIYSTKNFMVVVRRGIYHDSIYLYSYTHMPDILSGVIAMHYRPRFSDEEIAFSRLGLELMPMLRVRMLEKLTEG